MGTSEKEEGAQLGREEGDEVTPLACHAETVVCLHLHCGPGLTRSLGACVTPQDPHPTGGWVSPREMGGYAERATEAKRRAKVLRT